MNGKWYDGYETIEFKGGKYVVLEDIAEFLDEDGNDCGMGVIHAVDVAAEPNEDGLYLCTDLSFTRGAEGEWIPDDTQLMGFGGEDGEVVGLMHWNPKDKCYVVVNID